MDQVAIRERGFQAKSEQFLRPNRGTAGRQRGWEGVSKGERYRGAVHVGS